MIEDFESVAGNAFEQMGRLTESYLNIHIRSFAMGAREQLRGVISATENLGDPEATIGDAAILAGRVLVLLDKKRKITRKVLELSANYSTSVAKLFAEGEIPMPGIEDLLAQPPALGTETQEPDRDALAEEAEGGTGGHAEVSRAGPVVPRRIKVRNGKGKPQEQDTMGYKPEHFNMPIEELGLDAKDLNALRRASHPYPDPEHPLRGKFYIDHPIKIDTVGDLLGLDEDKDLLNNVKYFGPASLDHVYVRLLAKGFHGEYYAPDNDLGAWYFRGTFEPIDSKRFGK